MKKMLCTALAAALTLGMLSGCGQKGEPGASNQPGGAVPMGRYIEEPGETLDGSVRTMDLHRAENGDMVFYARFSNDDGTGRLEKCVLPAGGGAMVRTEQTWAAELNRVRDVSEAPDGTLYVLAYDGDYNDKVYRVTGGVAEPLSIPELEKSGEAAGGAATSGSVSVGGAGSVTVGGSDSVRVDSSLTADGADGADGGDGGSADAEPPIISFHEGGDNDAEAEPPIISVNDSGAENDGAEVSSSSSGTFSVEGGTFSGQETMRYLTGVRALPDGEFLLIYGGSAISRYGADGRLRMEYPSAGYNGQVRVWNGQLVTAGPVEKSIVVYDLATGTKAAESTYDALDFTTVLGLDDQGLYLADGTGVYRQSVGGSVWERLVDGDLTSLAMPTWTLNGAAASGESFYALLEGESSAQVMRYVYDENTPTLPDKELVIFGLKDNNTVRQAIGEFQRRNPTVRVNFQVMLGEDSAATAEDVIRALNTELLAGKGPDLLLLDGLPVESYIEKGVLADLTDQLKALVDGQDLMENMTRAYQRDGRAYGVPARFTLPVMMGKKEDVDRILSLADLVEAVEARQGGDPQFLYSPKSLHGDTGVFMDYYDTCASALVGRKGADQAGLTEYLSLMARMQAALKANTPELGGEVAIDIVVATAAGSGFEVMDPGAANLGRGQALFHVQELVGMLGLRNILSSLDDGSWAMDSLFGGGSYTPAGSVGIVTTTKQMDLAQDFLDLLLSPAVQDHYLYDGFPVNGGSLDRLVGEIVEETGGDDMGFRALCGKLDAPILADQVVRDAVEAQAKALTDGTVTPEQAAANVVDKTKLYLAE